MKSSDKRAKELIHYLIKLNTLESSGSVVPKYKFYSNVIEELLRFRNSYGAEIRTSLKEIRGALSLELKEVKKVKELMQGGYFQYLFMSCFIWCFAISSESLLEVKLSFEGIALIAVWQALGFALLVLLVQKYYQILFKPFDAYFMQLYRLKTMLRASRPLDDIVKIVGSSKEKTYFRDIDIRVALLFKEIKQKGMIDLKEVDYLLLELWDQFELQFDRLSSRLTILKLASLVLFVLPSFFVLIFLKIHNQNYFQNQF